MVLYFLLLFEALSCIPFPIDKQAFKFDFTNDSDGDLFIIVDLLPNDDRISPGSDYQLLQSHESGIYASHPWQMIVKDSMYLYILDSHEIVFLKDVGTHTVNEKQIAQITDEMILSVLTVYHKDLVPGTNRSFSYP